MSLAELKERDEAPQWLDQAGYDTLCGGYLLADETPRAMYTRIARAAGYKYSYTGVDWISKFFDCMWKNWLCPSSPIYSNLGTERGLPISCNSIHVDDSIRSIFKKNTELAILSKNGAGVGIYLGDIRARGTNVSGNGRSEGVIPWAKVYDTTTLSVNQGTTRRGASAIYLPVRHGDIEEFIHVRKPVGDVNRRCLNIHHGITIDDVWMREMLDGNKGHRRTWESILDSRVTSGEPYLFFNDNVNNQNPDCYKDKGLKVVTSNICNEIYLHTDVDHSFVCCLSSLNLARWDEWKDTDLPQVAVRFLDSVLTEYTEKGREIDGLEASVRSAVKGRAIGVGVLGWHSLLQDKNLAFDSFDSMMLNSLIFKTIRDKAEIETRILAKELGEPFWCKGFNRRNTHLIALAPTVTNSIISGGYSAGIEPIAANVFSQRSSKGTFIRKNRQLESILEAKGKNDSEVWKSINEQFGSVQHLKFLSDQEKLTFLTAREINQYALIKQASQRQKFIDQGQSVNLFFAANATPKYIHGVHVAAWEEGLKGLYYFRSEGVIKGDLASRSKEECASCES